MMGDHDVHVTCLWLVLMGANALTEVDGADAMKVKTRPAAEERGAMVMDIVDR